MRRFIIAPNWLRFLIVLLLVLGIFFRFYNLEGKVYWHDETYTSLRMSGYTASAVKQQIFNSRVLTKEDFAKFQRPNLENDLGDTIKSLAIEDPQHPPLYYIIARFWVQIFGNSVTAIRSLSALISLLVLFGGYWLCQELFNVPFSLPGIAIALMAISPIHLIFAQEAREYILWLLTILLCSASLLRAIRLETYRLKDSERIYNWGIYAGTLTLSLYTFLLSGFVALAHVIYVIALTKRRWNKILSAYSLATLVGFIAFIPWILVVVSNFLQLQMSLGWTTMKLSFIILIQSWFLQVIRIFFDLDVGFENPLSYLITPAFLILVGYAIYFLYLTTHPKTWLFIITLITIPALPLMLPDLIFGGVRSVSGRYLIPSYLGIQLAVAYLLATQLYNGILSRRRIWQTIMVLVIMAGVVSCAVSSQANTWWSKVISYGNPQVAKIVNQAARPLVISNDTGINYGNIFSLSYLAQPKVRFQLVKGNNVPKISPNYNVFLFNPSKTLQKAIEKKYKYKAVTVYKDQYYSLLKLTKPKGK
ncbi:glycosyltransferase family 39 protein [Iningainema tapete]|uniref:Glycosyltransferase family 39 protein n=1 Tax=Iningainema tapete BLCC-T55 TaxID=2748662 RepID=A0A8J7C9J5_9CYAN|nr:glycosyltransferase family 39 protein [Iningainema tapete]MBD2771015.1 glycosyltransferase family 39 protein [Iningainema tapete BLCC-T55]